MIREWLAPLAVVAMLLAALVLALLVIRRHGRAPQRAVERAERGRPAAAPGRTVVAAAVAFASVAAFTTIAREVVTGDVHTFDTSLQALVRRLDSDAVDRIMRAATAVGTVPGLVIVALVVAAWAHLRGDKRAAAALLVVLAITEALNVTLKHTFDRARPELFEDIAALHTYSFPSGHAMGSAAVFGMAGIVVARIVPRLKSALVVLVPLLVLLVGVSRIYLGAHWPTDVLAGFVAGGFLVLAGAVALDGVPRLGDLSRRGC